MNDFHHDIAQENPELKPRIHDLKTGNAHFARIYDAYHDLDKQIVRIEQEIEPTDDLHAEELKKKRALLKDEIFDMIRVS